MTTFPPIADYAFLSDCEASMLVAPDGSVEWLCLPRPDSPSLFGALLDRAAGSFRFGPSTTQVPNQRRYVPGTNVLETTWHTPSGWLTVWDLLVIGPSDPAKRREGYRRVPGDDSAPGHAAPHRQLLRGTRRGRGRTASRSSTTGVAPASGATTGTATTSSRSARATSRSRWSAASASARSAPAATGARRSRPVESAFVALSWGDDAPESDDEAFEQLHRTETFWRDWLTAATIPDHRWRPYIERSALALKGLSYAPTGAIMAAATTSLPETPGGERNWDYRYTWIRDSAFMLRALHSLGFDWEAFEYFAFVIDAASDGQIDAELRSPDHVRHRRRARPDRAHARPPVRAGGTRARSASATARGTSTSTTSGGCSSTPSRSTCARAVRSPRRCGKPSPRLVDTAIERAPEPDQGIWEMRGEPKHFVASKVMCWIAADRGVQLANARGDTERAERWQKAADDDRARTCSRRASTIAGCSASTTTPTISMRRSCCCPIMGFLPPDDERSGPPCSRSPTSSPRTTSC